MSHQNLTLGFVNRNPFFHFKSTCSAKISFSNKFLLPASVTPLSQLLQCCIEKVSSKQHYFVAFSLPSTGYLFSSLLDATVLVSPLSEVA